MKRILFTLLIALFSLTYSAFAEDVKENSEPEVSASPKNPWGEFSFDEDTTQKKSNPWWAKVLLWVPNRVLDLVDVFRVDVGVGGSFGGVVRLTRYGQIGYRSVSPVSIRVGDFGRELPFMIENSSELGIGPGYINSKNRKVCKGELGLGLDLIVGGYAGICVDELVDFGAGIFFIDVSNDDLK